MIFNSSFHQQCNRQKLLVMSTTYHSCINPVYKEIISITFYSFLYSSSYVSVHPFCPNANSLSAKLMYMVSSVLYSNQVAQTVCHYSSSKKKNICSIADENGELENFILFCIFISLNFIMFRMNELKIGNKNR